MKFSIKQITWSQIKYPLFAGLTLVYLVIALGFTNRKAAEHRCNHIQIHVLDSAQNMFVEPQDIQQIIKSNKFDILGYPFKSINEYSIELAIKKHPSIDYAQVKSTAKGYLLIDVTQRQPVVRVLNNDGSGYYIDSKGKLMPLSNNYTTRVPVLTGNFVKSFSKYRKQNLTTEKSDSLLRNVFELALALKESPYWLAMTDQLYVDEKGRLCIIPKIGADEIILGQNRNFAKELELLTTFYTEVLPVVGWEKYKTIDIRFNRQIVCS